MTRALAVNKPVGGIIASCPCRPHSLLLFFLIGCSTLTLVLGHRSLGVRELINETTNKNLSKVNELVGLNLVVMIRVNRSEHGVNIFVGDRHANVITSKEVAKELAELTPVQERISVVVVLLEVLHHFLCKPSLVLLEAFKLSEGSVKFSFLKVCWIDHFFD